MTNRAPIVNDAFIQARKQEAERAAQPRVAVKGARKEAGQRSQAPVSAHSTNRPDSSTASTSRPVTAAITPTLTIAVDRGPAPGPENAVKSAGGTKTGGKRAAQAKRKVRHLQEPKPGFMNGLWKLFFGMVMGINIAVSALFAAFLFYGSWTGKLWEWIPLK